MDQNTSLTHSESAFLHELQLSQDAVDLYGLLLVHGPLSAQAAAILRNQFANAQYRLFYKLEKYGLARRLTARPIQFEAVERSTGFVAAYQVTETRLRAELAVLTGNEQSMQVQTLFGSNALYGKYMELAEAARDSIDVFTIGLGQSAEFFELQQRVRRRGVRVRHVFQDLHADNHDTIRLWRKRGIRLKMLTAERGYHVMLFDSAHVIVSFSDPQNTDGWFSIASNDQKIVALFTSYFEDIWNQAGDIEF